MRFPISARRSFELGCTLRVFTGYIKKVQPNYCLQQGDPDTLFLKETTFIYLSSVKQLNTRPRYVKQGNKEDCQCKNKDQLTTIFQDKGDWLQVFKKI